MAHRCNDGGRRVGDPNLVRPRRKPRWAGTGQPLARSIWLPLPTAESLLQTKSLDKSGRLRRRLRWAESFGAIAIAGVEGTSSYGVGLTRVLQTAGVEVAEVSRPDRAARRRQGKSDPLDAYAAARDATGLQSRHRVGPLHVPLEA